MTLDWSLLDRDFATRLKALMTVAKMKGLRLSPQCGYRSPAESDRLYSAWIQGGKKGPRAAPGGKSAHNYGLAVDVLCLDAEGKVVESSEAPEYVLLEDLAQRYGLKTLRALSDGGHVELDGWEDRVKFLDVTGGSSVV